MDKVIEQGEKFSYTDKDISRLLDNKVRILTYPEIAAANTLQEIVGSHGCACILYMTKQNFGHWTALLKNPGGEEGCYEVFDPYGIMPDDELKYIDGSFRESSGQAKPHLSHIIAGELRSGNIRNVYYNKYKLQKYMQDVNTCGRWCAYRCLLRESFALTDFISLFKGQKNEPDFLVTALTLLNR
jgi:hypothetical protein